MPSTLSCSWYSPCYSLLPFGCEKTSGYGLRLLTVNGSRVPASRCAAASRALYLAVRCSEESHTGRDMRSTLSVVWFSVPVGRRSCALGGRNDRSTLTSVTAGRLYARPEVGASARAGSSRGRSSRLPTGVYSRGQFGKISRLDTDPRGYLGPPNQPQPASCRSHMCPEQSV